MMASILPMIGIGIAAAGIEATSGHHMILGSAGVVVGLILVVVLVIARPHLVERQGITGDSNAVVAEGVPIDFLLGAIRVYATDPGRRAAIGTPANWWLELAGRTISGALVVNLAGKVHPITWIRQRLAGNSPGPFCARSAAERSGQGRSSQVAFGVEVENDVAAAG